MTGGVYFNELARKNSNEHCLLHFSEPRKPSSLFSSSASELLLKWALLKRNDSIPRYDEFYQWIFDPDQSPRLKSESHHAKHQITTNSISHLGCSVSPSFLPFSGILRGADICLKAMQRQCKARLLRKAKQGPQGIYH